MKRAILFLFSILIMPLPSHQVAMFKTGQDMVAENLFEIETLATIHGITKKLCAYQCKKKTRDKANVRIYSDPEMTCQCLFAPFLTNDPGKSAQHIVGSTILVDSWYQDTNSPRKQF